MAKELLENIKELHPFKGTKGNFNDGNTGWKAVPYDENNKVGFSTHEIHWSDDGECVAEVVHEETNAKLIAAAPEMHSLLNEFIIQGIKDNPNQDKVFDITARAQKLLIKINQ